MVGQGRPSTGRTRFALRLGWPIRILIGFALAAPWMPIAQTLAAEPTMLLRVGWGGGAERQWHGSISIDKGTLALVRPLGIIADSPGSIWASSETRIDIRERS